ncbi:hypothetical protein FRC06_003255 [Ceratobasidium sp. 370]|nr:hypothetical protein FRC06_003255 [Ceratobasidium sp. 370]
MSSRRRRGGKARQGPTSYDGAPSPHIDSQPEYQPPPLSYNAPSSQPHVFAQEAPGAVPFLDNNTQRPVLPSLSTMVQSLDHAPEAPPALAPPGVYNPPSSQVAARPTNPRSLAPSGLALSAIPTQISRPSELAPHPPVQRIAHGGFTPLAGTYGHESPAHPALPISHIRTRSIASSAGYSSSGYGPGLPSESVVSNGSSGAVTSPGNSNAGPGASWQPGNLDCIGGPAGRPVSGAAPSLNPNPSVEMAPRPQPPLRAAAPTPLPQPMASQALQPPLAPVQHYFTEPSSIPGAEDRLKQALAPQSRGKKPCQRRVFKDLAAHPRLFHGTRPVELIYEHFLKLKEPLKDIQRFSQYHSIDFSGPDCDNEEEVLRRIQHQLNELAKVHGIKLGITAWRLYQYIIQSWYHRLRVSALADPTTQTDTTRRSGAISPVSAASAPPALPAQPPMPSYPPAHAAASSRAPTQAPMPPRAPMQASASSAPINTPMPAPAPPLPPSQPQDSPRTPSTSSFRVPRDPLAGRLARRNASGSVYARSATGSLPTGQTPTQSESSSAGGLSRMTGSPAIVSVPTGFELVRQGQKQLELREKEVTATVKASEAAVEQNERVNDLTMTLMQASFDLTHQEAAQHMQLEQQRMELEQARLELERTRLEIEQQRLQLQQGHLQLEQQRLQLEGYSAHLRVEHRALESVTSQMSTGAVPYRAPALTIGPQEDHPNHSSPLLVPSFNDWLNQTRAYHAHLMGYPGLVPEASPSNTSPTVDQAVTSHIPQAGSSNHPGRLRGLTPPSGGPLSSSRFEDMGTVRGTPRARAMGDGAMNEVDGMELEDRSPVENTGEY